MITAIAHACLSALNLEQTERFYNEILGLEKKFDFNRGDERIGFYLKINEHNFIEVFKGNVPEAQGPKRIRHLCLEVDDIDELIAKLDEYNIEHRDKKFGVDGSWQVWSQDPSGIELEFHQYTPESSQLTGKDCEVNW